MFFALTSCSNAKSPSPHNQPAITCVEVSGLDFQLYFYICPYQYRIIESNTITYHYIFCILIKQAHRYYMLLSTTYISESFNSTTSDTRFGEAQGLTFSGNQKQSPFLLSHLLSYYLLSNIFRAPHVMDCHGVSLPKKNVDSIIQEFSQGSLRVSSPETWVVVLETPKSRWLW